jgi:hypothetical protein
VSDLPATLVPVPTDDDPPGDHEFAGLPLPGDDDFESTAAQLPVIKAAWRFLEPFYQSDHLSDAWPHMTRLFNSAGPSGGPKPTGPRWRLSSAIQRNLRAHLLSPDGARILALLRARRAPGLSGGVSGEPEHLGRRHGTEGDRAGHRAALPAPRDSAGRHLAGGCGRRGDPAGHALRRDRVACSQSGLRTHSGAGHATTPDVDPPARRLEPALLP